MPCADVRYRVFVHYGTLSWRWSIYRREITGEVWKSRAWVARKDDHDKLILNENDVITSQYFARNIYKPGNGNIPASTWGNTLGHFINGIINGTKCIVQLKINK